MLLGTVLLVVFVAALGGFSYGTDRYLAVTSIADLETPAVGTGLWTAAVVVFVLGNGLSVAYMSGRTVAESLGAVHRNRGALAGWTMLATAAGVVFGLAVPESGTDRLLLGVPAVYAWAVLTYYLVPAVVLDDRPLVAGVVTNVRLLRRYWVQPVIVELLVVVIGGVAAGQLFGAAVWFWLGIRGAVFLFGPLVFPFLAAWALVAMAIAGFAYMVGRGARVELFRLATDIDRNAGDPGPT